MQKSRIKNSPSEDRVDIIEVILDRLSFTIFVRSGFPEKVVSSNSELKFVKVIKKTGRVDDIIEET